MLTFKAQGHRIISLTQVDGIEINTFLKQEGIEANSYVIDHHWNILFYFRHLLYFIRFCRKNNVSVVFSHLDSANFVASIGQYFIPAKVFLCRHHIDEAALYNYHLSWSYRLTNKLAKKIIVVSSRAKNYMIEVEKVPEDKLIHINLAYDFSLYRVPKIEDVRNIRKAYPADVLLVTACRLTQFKRPDLSIKAIQKLTTQGVNASLIILGNGEMRGALSQYIQENNLTEKVFLLGHVNNVLDYLAAADYLIHPSILESSCVVVKEAGLVKKPVIVCQNIGDFDDYLKNGYNGFLVDRDQFAEGVANVVLDNIVNMQYLDNVGENLSNDILRLFAVENVIQHYRYLIM